LVFKAKGKPNLEALPARPRGRAHAMPPPIEKLFDDRPLGSGHPIWLVGRFDNAQVLQKLLAVIPLGLADRSLLAKVRSIRAGFRFDRGIAFVADLEAQGAKAAAEMEKLLDRQEPRTGRWVARRKPGDHWVSVQTGVARGAWPRNFGKP
jgi:hypothetical protein